MDDVEFFDLLYQQWSNTTGAQDTYWMPEEFAELFDGYKVVSVRQDGSKETVALGLTEADADFITAVHGCLGDLVRRMHAALDEAERYNVDRDARECRIAELEQENLDLRSQVYELELRL